MIRAASTRRVRLHLKGPDELFLIGKRAPGRGRLFRDGHHPLCVLHTEHATDVSWCVVLQSFRGKLLQPRDLKISQSHESLQRNEGIQQPEAYTSKTRSLNCFFVFAVYLWRFVGGPLLRQKLPVEACE